MIVPIALALVLLGTMVSRGRLQQIRAIDIVSLVAIGFALGVSFSAVFRRA